MSILKYELHHIPCLPGCGDFGHISTCPVCLLKAEWQDQQAENITLRTQLSMSADREFHMLAELKELRGQNFDMYAELKSLREDNTLKYNDIQHLETKIEVWRTAYEGLRARLLVIRKIVSEEN